MRSIPLVTGGDGPADQPPGAPGGLPEANQSALLGKLIAAQEEERKAIANDLHDDTVQVLATALVQLDHIAASAPEQQPELLRKLMFDLRPPVLDAEGLVAVLSDDGVGFDVAEVLPKALAGGHLGLHALLERIDLAGGKVELRSHPGEGTRLHLSVPDLGGASQ